MTDKYVEIKELRLKIEKLEKHRPSRFLTLLGCIMSVIFVVALISIIIYKKYIDLPWLLFFAPGPFLVVLNNKLISTNEAKIKQLENQIKNIEQES